LTQLVEYVVAFVLCLLVFATVRSRSVRQASLLVASYALYLTWGIWFAAVLILSTVVNFLFGRALRRTPSGSILFLGLAFNVALLGAFKYLPETSVHLPLASLQPIAHLAMPLGISFWTFQAMSYLFDLYQGDELDPTFFEFALYMVFFPVTISGPVCRLPEMLSQFRSENSLQWRQIWRGFRRIATGVLMMQVAKLLGQGILAGDSITSGFDSATRWSGPDVWCLAFGFGLQLFFDFAGYSHIAKVLGFTLPENFARPFASTNPSVFWTRWHMSLSFWIRDYVFFPLMRLRRAISWRQLCLVISMTLFGLWHKASLLFLIWGFYHGVLLVLHRQIEGLERKYDWNPPQRLWTALSWTVTIALISLGWIFFRAHTLAQGAEMLAAVVSPATYVQHFLSASLYSLVLSVAAGYATVLWIADLLEPHPTETFGRTTASTKATQPSAFTQALIQWRWFWLTPIYFVVLAFLLFLTLSHATSTAQLIYERF